MSYYIPTLEQETERYNVPLELIPIITSYLEDKNYNIFLEFLEDILRIKRKWIMPEIVIKTIGIFEELIKDDILYKYYVRGYHYPLFDEDKDEDGKDIDVFKSFTYHILDEFYNQIFDLVLIETIDDPRTINEKIIKLLENLIPDHPPDYVPKKKKSKKRT